MNKHVLHQILKMWPLCPPRKMLLGVNWKGKQLNIWSLKLVKLIGPKCKCILNRLKCNYHPFRSFAILGLIVLPEACVLVEVVDNLVAADQDQGLGRNHDQRGNDPKQIKQSGGATMSVKCTIFGTLSFSLVRFNKFWPVKMQIRNRKERS